MNKGDVVAAVKRIVATAAMDTLTIRELRHQVEKELGINLGTPARMKAFRDVVASAVAERRALDETAAPASPGGAGRAKAAEVARAPKRGDNPLTIPRESPAQVFHTFAILHQSGFITNTDTKRIAVDERTALDTFPPDKTYDEVVMDFFSNLLLKRRSDYPSLPRIKILSTQLKSLIDIGEPNTLTASLVASKVFAQKEDTEVVLWPFNANGSHWGLFAVFLRRSEAGINARIQYIDSIETRAGFTQEVRTTIGLIRVMLRATSPDINIMYDGPTQNQLPGDLVVEPMGFFKWPLQKDSVNCGPLVCAAMECIASGLTEADYTTRDLPNIRRNIMIYEAGGRLPARRGARLFGGGAFIHGLSGGTLLALNRRN